MKKFFLLGLLLFLARINSAYARQIFTGYKSIMQNPTPNSVFQRCLIKLKTRTQELQEITVSAKSDKSYFTALKVFVVDFLGESSIASKCKILTPQVLRMLFNPQAKIL